MNNKNNTTKTDCPMCIGTGNLLKDKVVLRGEAFHREVIPEKCFLCHGGGIVLILNEKK